MLKSKKITLPLTLSVLAMAAMCPMALHATESVEVSQEVDSETPSVEEGTEVLTRTGKINEAFDLSEYGVDETTEYEFDLESFVVDKDAKTATPLKYGTFRLKMTTGENVVELDVTVEDESSDEGLKKENLEGVVGKAIDLSKYEVEGTVEYKDADEAFDIDAEAKTATPKIDGIHVLTIANEDGDVYELTITVAPAMPPAVSMISLTVKVNDVINLADHGAVAGTEFTDADEAFEIDAEALTAKALKEGVHNLDMKTSESSIVTLQVTVEAEAPKVEKIHRDQKLNDVIDLSEFGVDENTSYGFTEGVFELDKEAKTLKVLKEGTNTVVIKLSDEKTIELEISVPVTQTTSETTTETTTSGTTTDDGKGKTTDTGDEATRNMGLYILGAAAAVGAGGVVALKKKKEK